VSNPHKFNTWLIAFCMVIVGGAAVFLDGRPAANPPKKLAAVAPVITGDDIQAMLDAAVAPGGNQTVQLPAGTIVLTKPLSMCQTSVFSTVHLVGAGRNYVGDGNGTTLVCNYEDGPAIDVVAGRNCTIKHLSLRGPYYTQLQWKPPGLKFTDWPGKGSVTTPSVGISTDYHGTTGGSSNTWIEDVEVNGFEVGVCTTPSGGDGNGDFLSLVNTSIMNCTWGISISQTQMRCLSVSGGYYANMYTFLTNGTHGRKSGELNALIRSAGLGQIVRLCNLTQAYSGAVVFQSVYGEQIGYVGNFSGAAIGGADTVIRDSDFMWNFDPSNPTFAVGGALLLDGGNWLCNDLAVFDCDVEVRGTRFYPVNYTAMGWPPKNTPQRRKAANASFGMLPRFETLSPNYPTARARQPHTYVWFPSPANSDTITGNNGAAPKVAVRSFPKAQCSYQNNTIVLPTQGTTEQMLGALVQDDQPGRTTWIITGNPTGKRWILERLNNLGAPVDAVTGNFWLLQ
jgi:hypothetical protein